MPETSSSGLRIVYGEQGVGDPTLLLLPGWCVSRGVFAPLIEHLASRHRVLDLDWRGHGDSAAPHGDFGAADLVADALAVMHASGADQVLPVTLSDAGWVGIELLRQRPDQVVGLAWLDWLVTEPPRPFAQVLGALQTPERWSEAREQFVASWLESAETPEACRFVHKVSRAHGFGMWARAAREIGAAYAAAGSPLDLLARRESTVPVRHLHSYHGEAYIAAQQAFSATYPWFQAWAMPAWGHFLTFEAPEAIARAIDDLVEGIRPASVPDPV